MRDYEVMLDDGTAQLEIPARSLRDLLSVLIDGSRQAARFAVDGVSSRGGPRPFWVDTVGSLTVTGLHHSTTTLRVGAPTLKEAAGDAFGFNDSMFEQPADQGQPQPDDTALDLFLAVLERAARGEADVDADRRLLDTCVAAFAALPPNTRSFTVAPGPGQSRITLQADQRANVERLRDTIPQPHAIRLTGTLDEIAASRPVAKLKLKDGKSVPLQLLEHDIERQRQLYDRLIVVSGIAHYHASGKIRRIEVEFYDEAGAGAEVFEQLPPAPGGPLFTPQVQDERSGVGAFFGTWDGDETDDEWEEMLKGLD